MKSAKMASFRLEVLFLADFMEFYSKLDFDPNLRVMGHL